MDTIRGKKYWSPCDEGVNPWQWIKSVACVCREKEGRCSVWANGFPLDLNFFLILSFFQGHITLGAHLVLLLPMVQFNIEHQWTHLKSGLPSGVNEDSPLSFSTLLYFIFFFHSDTRQQNWHCCREARREKDCTEQEALKSSCIHDNSLTVSRRRKRRSRVAEAKKKQWPFTPPLLVIDEGNLL